MIPKEQFEKHLKDMEKYFEQYGFQITSKNIEAQMLKVLKEKLSIRIEPEYQYVESGFCDYKLMKSIEVKVYFGDELLTESKI